MLMLMVMVMVKEMVMLISQMLNYLNLRQF
jgi:hypothetical protein